MLQDAGILSTREGLGQPVRDAAFFSSSSNSLRPTLDLSFSKMRFRSSLCLFRSPLCSFRVLPCSFRILVCSFRSSPCFFRVNLISCISSVFLPACSNVAFSFSCMPGIISRYGLNSERIASISVPTSVPVNLSTFFGHFSMNNIIMKEEFSVKQIISGEGTA